MSDEPNTKQQPGGGSVASWLARLLGPGKPGGRLKAGTVKSLVWLGILAVAGVAVMGLGDIFKSAPQAGSTAPPVATTGTLAAGSSGNDGSAAAAASGSQADQGVPIAVNDLETMIENHLESILSQIEGAGEVQVAVSLQTGATYVYGYDESETSQTTQETDANGGSRTVTETDSTREAVIVTSGSASGPLLVRVELPPLAGVVVVATGATDSVVKARLAHAVEVLYGVPAYRIDVIPGH